MADLGTIIVSIVPAPIRGFNGPGSWASATVKDGSILPARSNFLRGYSPCGAALVAGTSRAARDGTITGTVMEAGVPQANVRVGLLHRSGELDFCLAQTWTSPNGIFTFKELETTEQYSVVALDPEGGTSYNAIIYDKVTPV